MMRGDISASQARQLAALNDPEVMAALSEHWGLLTITPGARIKEIAAWKEKFTPGILAKADVAKGQAQFQLLCSACHKMHGEGGVIGPDLTGSGRQNLDHNHADGAQRIDGFG